MNFQAGQMMEILESRNRKTRINILSHREERIGEILLDQADKATLEDYIEFVNEILLEPFGLAAYPVVGEPRRLRVVWEH